MSTRKSEILFVLKSFLIWRIGLFVVLALAVKFVPLQRNFLGGGMTNQIQNPWLWSWANFDGEHYLAISQMGYGHGEEALFPLYPLLIRIFGGGVWAGLLISNFAFLLALWGLYKLVKLDFKKKVAKLAIISLLVFPTSFYFGSVYTESLFLCLIIWSFYLARKGKWVWASLAGIFASATRIIGTLLFPALILRKRSPWLVLIPVGLVAYMFFLQQTTGDLLRFLHALPIYGEQRSSTPVFLLQVFYRYFFKILPNLNYSYFAGTFPVLLELFTALVFLDLAFISFWRFKADYAVFLFLGYLVPTLSGSFSSLPRYVLVLFPAFILLAEFFVKRKFWKYLYLTISAIILAICLTLFARGFWVA